MTASWHDANLPFTAARSTGCRNPGLVVPSGPAPLTRIRDCRSTAETLLDAASTSPETRAQAQGGAKFGTQIRQSAGGWVAEQLGGDARYDLGLVVALCEKRALQRLATTVRGFGDLAPPGSVVAGCSR